MAETLAVHVMKLRSKKRKLLNGSVGEIDDEEDMKWNLFFQNALQADPKLEYKENNPCYCYSENGIDFEVTEREQQRYISFLNKIPEMYKKLKYWPNPKQKMLTLALAAYVSQTEKNFLQVNANDTYKTLIKMAQISKCTTNCLVKVRYMDMLCSFFEHDAGLRWSLETNYWTGIYDLVVDCQNNNCATANKVHSILSKLLQRTSRFAPNVCVHIVKQMTESMINVAQKNFPKMKKQPTELINPNDYENLSSSVTCLVEILELLLASPVTESLKYFMKMQIREASETLSLLSSDTNFSLQLNRIIIILSFHEMTELFDGIKVVNHDPIALSGFLKIVEKELKKSHLATIFELYYYALKYWKYVERKMPQCFLKEKPIDIEDELMSFQVEPLVIIAEKLLGVPQTSEEELRNCYLADLLNMYSASSLQLGYEIRECLNNAPLDIDILALQYLIKSKPMYSRKNLAVVFQALTYSLRDFIKYVKKTDERQFDHDQLFAKTLFEAILVYLENFDLSWRESIGSIELTNLVYEFLYYSTRSSSEVILKALKTLDITISKHMSPNMALLVDTTQHSSLNDLGSILCNKWFSDNSEVRNAALTVVYTICQKVNKGFTSLKKIVMESLNQDLILKMTTIDSDPSVRATGLRCFQEMIVMEDVGISLLKCGFMVKVLELVSKENESMILREAITLIEKIYQCDSNSDEDNSRIYDVMVNVGLREKNPEVQEQAVKFWAQVIKKHLEKQGMTDDTFPAVIFSKECKKIIRMDDKEIRKRIFKSLDGMSKSGCFNVFQQILQNENTSKQVYGTTVTIISKLLRLLQQYEVTPEFILFNQTYPYLWSIPSNIQSPSSMEDDERMQEMIEETVMEMINGSVSSSHRNYVSTSSIETAKHVYEINTEQQQSVRQVSTVDFIDYIYRKLPYLIN